MKRLLLLALVFFAARTTAQTREPYRTIASFLRRASTIDTLRFAQMPTLVWTSPATYWYFIPADSIAPIVYGSRAIDPDESWLRTPAFTTRPNSTPDSAFGSARVSAGSYLGVNVQHGMVTLTVRRKAAFSHEFVDLRDLRLLVVTADNGEPTGRATVTLGDTRLTYDATMGGYTLPDRKGSTTLRIRLGEDVELLTYTYQTRDVPRPDYRTAERPAWNTQTFSGYLVTNKPKYTPGDTVKYKAYLLDPVTRKPATGPVEVSFLQDYSKKILVHPRLLPTAPGVYFSEFVVGDSIRVDRLYELRMEQQKERVTHTATGTSFDVPYGRTAQRENVWGTVTTSITQRFMVEDYLLENTFLKVTGEAVPAYQPGDSVLLWAHAHDASRLPLSDGTLSITVLPENVQNLSAGGPFFLPDTLYHARDIPVSATGETALHFATAGFPRAEMNWRIHIRLQSAAAEVRDTIIHLRCTNDPYYIQSRVDGDHIVAELMQSKKSVEGRGLLALRFADGRTTSQSIRYPYRGLLTGRMVSADFSKDAGSGRAAAHSLSLSATDALSLVPSYNRDTAFLAVQNPRGARLRYAWYRGNSFGGWGVTTARDTTLQFITSGGETITVLSEHGWNNTRTQRTPIYKWDKALSISVDKKPAVYPGATDTVDISLTDPDGKPVPRTNVTVLAFNGQYAEDFTPALEYRGVLRPSLAAPRFYVSLQPQYQQGSNRNYTLFDRRWLARCGLDTSWLYARVHSGTAPVVQVMYPAPDEPRARLSVLLQDQTTTAYAHPVAVWVDHVPVYYAFARGPSVGSIPVDTGVHHLRLRFPTWEITLPRVALEARTAHTILLHERRPYLPARRVRKGAAMDHNERYEALRHVQAYELESNRHSGSAWVGQGDAAVMLFHQTGRQIIGPIDPNRRLVFYQAGNTRIEHEAETGQVLSFREGMTRVRDEAATLLQNQSLYSGAHWNLFAPPGAAPRWPDTTPVYYTEPAVVREKARRREVPIRMKLVELPMFTETPTPDSLSVYRARLYLINRSPLHIKTVIVEGEREDERYMRSGNHFLWTLRPGRYSVLVVFGTDEVMSLGKVDVHAGGVTNLPIPMVPARLASVYTAELPAWVKSRRVKVPVPSAGSGSQQHHGQATVQPFYTGGSGGIYGTVVDENNEPVINATAVVTSGGILQGSAITDFDGVYSVKPLSAGTYTLTVNYVGYKIEVVEGIVVSVDGGTRVNLKLDRASTTAYSTGGNRERQLSQVEVRATRYSRPLIEPRAPGSRTVLTDKEIEKMPTRNPIDPASTAPGVYQSRSGGGLNIAGGRGENTLYVVDGIVQVGSRGISALPSSYGFNTSGMPASYGDASGGIAALRSGGVMNSDEDETPFLQSGAGQEFISAFLGGMGNASGIRRHFRDWAIWEPNLWTGKDGKASFVAHYPDNITAWKTYVLAMNERGFSGRQFSVTRAFKPLSAQLMVPRFLRYGDTVHAVTKVMNYTGNPFSIRTDFRKDRRPVQADSLTVNNARTASYPVTAPLGNLGDTGRVALAYTLSTGTGFTDGEEREMPVYPVGVPQWRTTLVKVMRDTTFETTPPDVHFTGLTRIAVDESRLGLMLREIEGLKEYPYGCTEQLTTRLLAISYEEEIKRAMNDTAAFNNTAVRKEIIQKLAKAQNPDGSFGWFGGNGVDYRITNYVLSTMGRIGDKSELRGILQQGYTFLARGLLQMSPTEQLTALSTLSSGNHPTNYRAIVERLTDTLRDDWSRFTIVRICQEQGLRCDSLLDSLAAHARYDRTTGFAWGETSYDWYRNRTATTALAYRVFAASPRHDSLANAILDYLLFHRKDNHYRSTAESGQLLGAVVPVLMKSGALKKGASSAKPIVRVTGGAYRVFEHFPGYEEMRHPATPLTIATQSPAPMFVTVSHQSLNPTPTLDSTTFIVRSAFVGEGVSGNRLKHSARLTLRAEVTVKKAAEYVLVEIPIPAGCVPDRGRPARNYYEESRETFRDRVAIFCRQLQPGTYSFDVPLEARYRGEFAVNPARAEMMYFPEERGNEVVKRVRVE